MPTAQVENATLAIFVQCREQIGLTLEEASHKTKIKALKRIEAGEKKPTFQQLEKLSNLYQVPQWVFIQDKLPEEYDFNHHMLSFRAFHGKSPAFNNYKVRAITASVEKYREFIIDTLNDLSLPMDKFTSPKINKNVAPYAKEIREWLGCKKASYHFEDWRNLIEQKNVFVFLTSKFSGKFKADPSLFRGVSLYREILPVIIINDSDVLQAQSFTLLHELAHLLRQENAIDTEKPGSYESNKTEQWCDHLASEILMPTEEFKLRVQDITITENTSEDIQNIKKAAEYFLVSLMACTIKMKHLKIINHSYTEKIYGHLIDAYNNAKEMQEKIPIKRNMPKEKLEQFGSIYTKTVIDAYHEKEIGFHKLCGLLNINNPSHAKELIDIL